MKKRILEKGAVFDKKKCDLFEISHFRDYFIEGYKIVAKMANFKQIAPFFIKNCTFFLPPFFLGVFLPIFFYYLFLYVLANFLQKEFFKKRILLF